MIDINSKNVLVAFMILIVLTCAIVFLVVNNDDKSSTIKLVTSVSQSVDTSGTTKSSSSKKTTTAKKERTGQKQGTTRSYATTAKSTKVTSVTTPVDFPIDINNATKDELIQIDGIGEKTAKKILNYRKKLKYYSNLLQLKEISGIGDATYKKLKKYLYVSEDKYKEITTSKVTSKTTKARTNKAGTSRTSKTTTTTAKKQMKIVNINTADKEKLMDSLLIDEEAAMKIIDYRETIGGRYNNTLELVYAIGENEYNRVMDYVRI